MTWDQFTAWYGFHVSHYEGIDAWMASAVKRQHDQPELTGQDEKMRAWFGQLRDTDYQLARKATAILAREPEDNQPRGYDAHPRRVAEIARGLADKDKRDQPRTAFTRTVGGQRTYRCLTCRDSGWVTVWGHLSVEHVDKLLRDGVPEDWKPEQAFDTGELTRWNGRVFQQRAGMYSALAACSCAAGENKHDRGTPLYDDSRFCRVWGNSPYRDSGRWSTEHEIAYLVHWVADRIKNAPLHQLPAF